MDEYNSQYQQHLDLSQLQQFLSFSQAWIDAERIELSEVDNAVLNAFSILSERKDVLAIHQQKRMSDRTPDQLKELSEAANAEGEALARSINEIDFRLDQDRKGRLKIGNLLTLIEAKASVVANWSKLYEVIGSQDGKKFRQYAQEYTLDVLLSFANIHLGMLTKRYSIQRIPNSLGLQVVDQDMGNDVRTVYSLSGGESFLVSLALALGLASLSSSTLQVESLFIDEGFGSLDPTTLNIAMDALERLQYQGRKVGVISHVQEMTERIPVQIRVSKQSSGRSRVEVLG